MITAFPSSSVSSVVACTVHWAFAKQITVLLVSLRPYESVRIRVKRPLSGRKQRSLKRNKYIFVLTLTIFLYSSFLIDIAKSAGGSSERGRGKLLLDARKQRSLKRNKCIFVSVLTTPPHPTPTAPHPTSASSSPLSWLTSRTGRSV